MKLQLPVRWMEKRLLDDDTRNLNRLLTGEDAPIEEATEFTYGRITMDTKDIRTFNELDSENIILRTYNSESYCIAIPFDDFSRIWSELTGEMITKIERKEVAVKKTIAKKKPKTPPNTNPEDEDFLK